MSYSTPQSFGASREAYGSSVAAAAAAAANANSGASSGMDWTPSEPAQQNGRPFKMARPSTSHRDVGRPAQHDMDGSGETDQQPAGVANLVARFEKPAKPPPKPKRLAGMPINTNTGSEPFQFEGGSAGQRGDEMDSSGHVSPFPEQQSQFVNMNMNNQYRGPTSPRKPPVRRNPFARADSFGRNKRDMAGFNNAQSLRPQQSRQHMGNTFSQMQAQQNMTQASNPNPNPNPTSSPSPSPFQTSQPPTHPQNRVASPMSPMSPMSNSFPQFIPMQPAQDDNSMSMNSRMSMSHPQSELQPGPESQSQSQSQPQSQTRPQQQTQFSHFSPFNNNSSPFGNSSSFRNNPNNRITSPSDPPLGGTPGFAIWRPPAQMETKEEIPPPMDNSHSHQFVHAIPQQKPGSFNLGGPHGFEQSREDPMTSPMAPSESAFSPKSTTTPPFMQSPFSNQVPLSFQASAAEVCLGKAASKPYC